ncbi:MAG: hypothetical protein K2Y37_11425 [Pirellulales bacterium]|nr:hypothetical protein [Pirellulales bacterium]
MKNQESDPLARLVERIVREVLARLAAAEKATAKSEPASGSAMGLVGRVISLADLKQLTDETRELQVATEALITPAAKDELRERGIQVVRGQQQSTTKNTGSSATGLVVGTTEAPIPIDTALTGLRRQKIEIQQLPRLPLVEQIDAIVEQVVRGGRRGVLVTSEVAGALCLANRQRGVRAVTGATEQGVRRDVEQLAANLLVVDSAGRSTFEHLQLLREFATSTAGQLSAVLRDRLE